MAGSWRSADRSEAVNSARVDAGHKSRTSVHATTLARIAEAEQMAEKALEFISGEAIYVRHDIATAPSLEKRIKHMEAVRSA